MCQWRHLFLDCLLRPPCITCRLLPSARALSHVFQNINWEWKKIYSQWRSCLASQGYINIHCLSIATCILPKMHKLHPNNQLQTHTWISTSTKLMYVGNGIPFLCTSWDHYRTLNCQATSFDHDPILETLIIDTQEESRLTNTNTFLRPIWRLSQSQLAPKKRVSLAAYLF